MRILWNLALLCRRHHVLWHLGKLHLHHLHTPWHPATRPRQASDDGADDLLVRAGP